MSWWRWTCSDWGACSFTLPKPLSSWAAETFFFCLPFLRPFQQPKQPFLLQQVNNQLVHDFLSQRNNRLFLSELMDFFVAGRDQSAADQPNNLAEGHPPLQPLLVLDLTKSSNLGFCGDLWNMSNCITSASSRVWKIQASAKITSGQLTSASSSASAWRRTPAPCLRSTH